MMIGEYSVKDEQQKYQNESLFYKCKSIMEESDKWNVHQIDDKEFLDNISHIMFYKSFSSLLALKDNQVNSQ